jgi:hypothetical protein
MPGFYSFKLAKIHLNQTFLFKKRDRGMKDLYQVRRLDSPGQGAGIDCREGLIFQSQSQSTGLISTLLV